MPALEADATFGFDPYAIADAHLSPAARRALARLQETLDRSIRPLLAEAWETATMPSEVLDALVPLDLMQPEDAKDVLRLMSYEEDTAGSMMTPEPVIVGPDATIADALALVRNPDLTPAEASVVYVCRPPLETPTGKFLGIERRGDGVRAMIRRRGVANTETFDLARVYDCGGVTVDVTASSNPLIRALVGAGKARPDAMHIGLDVTTDCRIVDAAGTPSPRLFALGPLTRGQFWEIEAIPDIRVQAARMAERLGAGEWLALHRQG